MERSGQRCHYARYAASGRASHQRGGDVLIGIIGWRRRVRAQVTPLQPQPYRLNVHDDVLTTCGSG
jgi:hypothetical protein